MCKHELDENVCGFCTPREVARETRASRTWTPRDDELVRAMVAGEFTAAEVATTLGCSSEAARLRARTLRDGLSQNTLRNRPTLAHAVHAGEEWSPTEDAAVLNAPRGTLESVAISLGRTYVACAQRRSKLGVTA